MGQLNALFVYDSLMRGLSNNRILIAENAFFMGVFRTMKKYRMTASWVPFVTDRYPDVKILGELWAVSDDLLARIDGIMAHPEYYTRRSAYVESVTTRDVTATAFMYFCDHKKGRDLVADGDFRHYRLGRDGFFTSENGKEKC